MELLEQINQKLQDTPLIYVTIEIERALGLETLLKNYHIICYEDSPIIDLLLAKGIDVYSVVRSGQEGETRKTTAAMLAGAHVKSHIEKITGGKHFYLQTFHPTKPFFFQAKQYDCTILNNDPDLTEDITDKLTMLSVMTKSSIKIPAATIGILHSVEWQKMTELWHTEKLVIQNRKSHTGEGTYIVSSEDELKKLIEQFGSTEFKIAEFIAGEPWTINGCVTSADILVAGLSYQITGIPELTNHLGSTVGNDWSYAKELDPKIVRQIELITQQTGELLKSRGYLGLFGVDVIVKGNLVYLIEVNTRQTANIPLESHLEIIANKTPLALFHLAAFMQLSTNDRTETVLNGAQLFNRSKVDGFKINTKVAIGEYRLQSDNSARNWDTMASKDAVIFLDEEQDKPLIFQKPSYSVTEIDQSGMQLLVGAIGIYKENQEICRLQLRNGIVDNGNLKPWILEAMRAIGDKLQ